MFKDLLFRLLPDSREVWGHLWFGDYLYVINLQRTLGSILSASENTHFLSVFVIELDQKQNNSLSSMEEGGRAGTGLETHQDVSVLPQASAPALC